MVGAPTYAELILYWLLYLLIDVLSDTGSGTEWPMRMRFLQNRLFLD